MYKKRRYAKQIYNKFSIEKSYVIFMSKIKIFEAKKIK
jgi:hypothetical protein